MTTAEPAAGRSGWRAGAPGAVLVAALVAITLARVALVLGSGYNGLYGQDAYAYFGYAAGSLVTGHGLAFPPPPFPFPPGYPYLVALGILLAGPAPWVGQLLSLAGVVAAALLTTGLGRMLWPDRPWVAAVAGSLVALDGQLGRAGLSVMSDGCGLALATAAVVSVIRYRRSGRGRWLTAAAATAAAAVLCRWAMALVALPVAVYAAAALIERPPGRALRHAAVALAVAALCLSPVLVAIATGAGGFTVDFDAAAWSPAHAFARTTVSTEGIQHHAAPPAVYYAVAPAHPSVLAPIMAGFLPLGLAGALVGIRRGGGRRRELALVVGWAAVAYLFLAGIPLRNPRFTLTFLPPLALLAASGAAWLADRRPAWRRPVAVAVAAGLAWAAVGGWRSTVDLVRLKARHLEIVRWVERELPADARLLSFWYTATVAFESRLEPIELYGLEPDEARRIAAGDRPGYLLVPEAVVRSQWRNRSPERALVGLERDPGLELVGTMDGASLYLVRSEHGRPADLEED